MVSQVTRWSRFKNLFTASGRAQNRLMSVGAMDSAKGKVKLDYFTKKIGNGRTMIQRYPQGALTSDATYIVDKGGNYCHISRTPIDPEKQLNGVVSGHSRIIEEYSRNGVLENLSARNSIKAKGAEAEYANVSLRTPGTLGQKPNMSLDVHTGSADANVKVNDRGDILFAFNDGTQVTGEKFNVFDYFKRILDV